MSELTTYTNSVVGDMAPKLIRNIQEVSTSIHENTIPAETKDFYVSVLQRKVQTTYKTPISRFASGKIVPVFNPSIKMSAPLIIPFADSGSVSTTFNLFPTFKKLESIDNVNMFFKLLTDASIQLDFYDNPLKYTRNREFVQAITYYYDKIFMQIFAKLISFNDANTQMQEQLSFATRVYVLKVLLNKPFNSAIDLALAYRRNKKEEMDITDSLKDDVNAMKNFKDFIDVVNSNINMNSTTDIDYRSFIKQLALMYPTLLFGVDMLQVMTGGIFSYMVSKAYSAEYIKLSKQVFDKNIDAKFFNAIK